LWSLYTLLCPLEAVPGMSPQTYVALGRREGHTCPQRGRGRVLTNSEAQLRSKEGATMLCDQLGILKGHHVQD
jgi:hypothetical protein